MDVEELEQEAEAIKAGGDGEIKSADSIISETGAEDESAIRDASEVVTSAGADADADTDTTSESSEERELETEAE